MIYHVSPIGKSVTLCIHIGALRLFSYEVDGLDYASRHGLPYPTYPAGDDGASTDIEISAMAPATLAEGQFEGEGFHCYIGDHNQRGKADKVCKCGSGMVVHIKRGRGEVLTAAACERVMGLTRNVLGRFLRD